MPSVIRLKRVGTKKKPHMRIVVCDSRSPRDGRFIEELGTYNPVGPTPTITLKKDRLLHWLKVGARPSPTVKKLIKHGD